MGGKPNFFDRRAKKDGAAEKIGSTVFVFSSVGQVVPVLYSGIIFAFFSAMTSTGMRMI